eukprot:13619119-Alexandrium_andersonii.AAC.1
MVQTRHIAAVARKMPLLIPRRRRSLCLRVSRDSAEPARRVLPCCMENDDQPSTTERSPADEVRRA